jgi:predicted flap endonuclease-1-like 5' DNA nuclease
MRTLMRIVLGIGIGLWLRDILYGHTPQPHAATTDNLASLAGIGPAFEEALHDIGIRSFAQLSRENADALADRLGGRVPAERIRRDRWIEQAKERS